MRESGNPAPAFYMGPPAASDPPTLPPPTAASPSGFNYDGIVPNPAQRAQTGNPSHPPRSQANMPQGLPECPMLTPRNREPLPNLLSP